MTVCQKAEIEIIKCLIQKESYELKDLFVEDLGLFVSVVGEIGLAEDEDNEMLKEIYRKHFHITINKKGDASYFSWATGHPRQKPFHNWTILEAIYSD